MRHLLVKIFVPALLATVSAAPFAAAQMPIAPTVKPELVAVSDTISTKDAGILRAALGEVDDGDWTSVARYQGQLRDSSAIDILTWYRARRDPAMSFSELNSALTRLRDWPDADDIRARAEEKLADSALSDQARIAWFRSHGGAESGAGEIAYADALYKTGQRDEAVKHVRAAWHGRTMNASLTKRVLADYGAQLTRDDHEKRADFLLWTRQTSAASQMSSLLGSDWRKLVDARSRLIRRSSGVDAAVRNVPASLADHPGLSFDRAQWRRRARMTDRVAPLLRDIDGFDVPPAGRGRLWDERNIAVRSALKDRDWALAYDLSAKHGMSEGQDFAEAEWTAGWVALRHLNDPSRALRHFESLEKGVGTPISLSRARYWAGRAKEAMNDSVGARAAYQLAAEYSFTYYGQLAAEKASMKQIVFNAAPVITDADREAFNRRGLVRALRLFAESGWDASFRKLAYHLDDQLTRPQDFELLAELGREYHYADIGVRGAKAGLAQGVVAPDAAYPLVDYPLLKQPRVERSLMLALSRQESEMNPAAISHANARGLMQFIPSTARAEARNQGLPYRTSWLTDDPGYNMTLGGAHLDTLLGQFNGSYIMTAAAYNAGASRPKRWVVDYGDPRRGEVDPVDWVEFIPFSETRNYVQRVLENTQVYRHRLSGQPENVQLSSDLQRGRFGN